MPFQPVDTRVSFPRLEEEVLEFWKRAQIVERSLAGGDKPFVFFEGPPTANGRPGIHHVISRVFKDVIPRFRAMQGYRIIGRREGWDTHGLPVEIEVEKKLGFNGKPDIERYGIAEFNARCRESVWEYIQEWKAFTRRIAFWVSEDAYITYENDYIESLWWIFRQLWDRGMLFRDYKVTMHCPRCGTSLSDHEVALGFQDDVDDPSVWVRFRIAGDHGSGVRGQEGAGAGSPTPNPDPATLDGASFLAWTTTPWTLPANVALAVKPDADYALVEHDGERLLLAAALVPQVLGEGARTLRTYRGSELVGLRYTPLFQGVPGPGDTVDWDSAYRVVADDFVSLEDGTGVVHIAPAYGDLEIGRKYGLPTLFSVDLSGHVLPEFGELGFAGKFFKEADPDITRNLRERGLLFRSGRVKHAYPFCWRCGTPLLYYAKRSWYIRTTARKDQLVANNQLINWVPEHIKEGRFGNWLANNIDWAISRERYWGTPLPIWMAEDGYAECIGSVAELEQKTGRSLRDLDLHRPYVDAITWDDPQHGTMRRIPDVADCWYDSGSMPVAQWHYPFENQELFEVAQQADYICEAVDQTRGWFYTLHAISTLLFDRPAFKNVICLGHILDGEGQKMSKSRGNVVEPQDVLDECGVDALRWYLFTSAPPGNPRRFSIALVNESLRKFLLTLWNTYSFFVTYANLDGWAPPGGAAGQPPLPAAAIDRWALARLNALVRDVTAALEAYDVTGAARDIEWFVDELSNWYVRRNRRRFWKAEDDADKQAAYQTLYTCLLTVTRLAAPFIPFVTEVMYRNLVGLAGSAFNAQRSEFASAPDLAAAQRRTPNGEPGIAESVHLAAWPTVDESLLDERLVADTELLLRAVSLGRAARRTAGLRVRQPLREMLVRAPVPEALRRFEAELRDELNVKAVRYLDSSADLVEYRLKPNLRLVGKKYGRLVPAITAALRELPGDAARAAARAVEAGEPVRLAVEGQELELLPEELLVESSSPEGYAVAEEGGVLVALDVALTPELTAEGLARELVRNIQDARKSAGLAIADRIVLYLGGVAGDPELEGVVREWGEYIREETLAEDLILENPPEAAYTEPVELDHRTVTVGVLRRPA
jgi:isoleucyl-tRNA synthetase